VPNDDPAWNDTFIYLIAHPSRAEAEAHWNAFHADPAFPPLRAAAAKLIQQVNGDYKVDEIFMRPSDFSRMKYTALKDWRAISASVKAARQELGQMHSG